MWWIVIPIWKGPVLRRIWMLKCIPLMAKLTTQSISYPLRTYINAPNVEMHMLLHDWLTNASQLHLIRDVRHVSVSNVVVMVAALVLVLVPDKGVHHTVVQRPGESK